MQISQQYIKIVGRFATIVGVCLMIKETYSGKRILEMTKRLEDKTNEALDLWNFEVYAKDVLDVISEKAYTFDQLCLNGKMRNMKLLLTICIGVITNLEEANVIKDPVKKSALFSINEMLYKMFNYFDSTGKDWDSYIEGTKAVKIWEDVYDGKIPSIKVKPVVKTYVKRGNVYYPKIDFVPEPKRRITI